MKRTILTALLTALPAVVLGEPAATRPPSATMTSIASQDPLARLVMRQQLTQPNGGVLAAVRIASGQSIELHIDLDMKPADGLKVAFTPGDPAAGLKPVSGLVAKAGKTAPAEKSNLAKKPLAQLQALAKKKAWGETSYAQKRTTSE